MDEIDLTCDSPSSSNDNEYDETEEGKRDFDIIP